MSRRPWPAFALVLALAAASAARAQTFDREGWLADLDQLRDGLSASYANLEWQASGRGLDLQAVYARARKRIEAARSEAEGRFAIDRFLLAFADGHLEAHWPRPPAPAAGPDKTAGPEPLCERLGYFDVGESGAIANHLPGFKPLEPGPQRFPAGIVEVGGRRVGVLRISIFEAQGLPDLCMQAATGLKLLPSSPCDDDCREAVQRAAEGRFMAEVQSRIEALAAARPDMLLVDVAQNGGGDDSALAIARSLTGRRLSAPRMGFIHGEGWARTLAHQEKDVEAGLKSARGADRNLLETARTRLEAARLEALKPCDRSPLWRGQAITCSGVSTTPLYAAGLLPDAPSGAFKGKPWGETLTSTARFSMPYGLWRGPLAVLIDSDSASATELFTAMLQDGRAAVIVGAPSFGAGCGHAMDDPGPLVLAHSKGEVSMPDCLRLRADGSNEMDGIQPDLLIGFRPNDTALQRQRRLQAALSAIIERTLSFPR